MAGLYPAGTMVPCEGCSGAIWPESLPYCDACRENPPAKAEEPKAEPKRSSKR